MTTFSDHNPLMYLRECAPKSAKLTRWALGLQEFMYADSNIFHTSLNRGQMSGENYWIPVGRCLADSGLDAANAFASDADEQQVSKRGGASPAIDDRRQTDRVTTPTGACLGRAMPHASPR